MNDGPRTWLVCGHWVEPSNADHCSTCLKKKLDDALLQIDDLKDSLGHREAQLNEALAKVQESNRLKRELEDAVLELSKRYQAENLPLPPRMIEAWANINAVLARNPPGYVMDIIKGTTSEKRVRLCDAIPPGGGQPCMKEPGHGGVCENEKDVWDWKPKHRHEK